MTAESKRRRKYADDFKREAVALVTEQGYSVAEAARSLDINSNLLGRWKQRFADEASGAGLSGDEREELKRLRREVRTLRMEKEILKKSKSVLCEGNEVKYGFIRDHGDGYPVTMLCRLLSVQRSALL